jgi:chromate reductase, NAD(P)H dehydrogenase (quinone)
MTPSSKLLIFAGSTRQNSFNRQLARVAADLARASGAAVTQFELRDLDIPMYNADVERQATPPDVMKLKQILFEHPAWIICSPEYNGSYTALLKNTIDWASSPVKSDPVWADGFKSFAGKVVGMLSASPGALGGLRSQATCCRCWSTCSAGSRPRPSRSAVRARPSMRVASSSMTNTGKACRQWLTRCCLRPRDCKPDKQAGLGIKSASSPRNTCASSYYFYSIWMFRATTSTR